MEDRPPDAPDPASPPDPWATAPPPPPGEPPPPAIIPWEEPGRPWMSGLIETLKLLFTRPREAFERMPVTGDVLKPFIFAIILGWIGAIANAVWNIAIRGVVPGGSEYSRYEMPAAWLPLLAAFAPAVLVIAILINTAFIHLFLMILGGARRGLAATLRAICYAQAPQIFLLVPLCGGLIAGVGALILTVIGLSAAHRIGIGRAALAVMLPTVLCCACVAILVATVGAGLMARYGGFGQ